MHRFINVSALTFILVASSLAQSANILNNGDFETGLMCYQNWIWSSTYQDFKGDYKFALSSDAHSGAHSLEIACNGPDCLRAAIYSNKIRTTPGQAYKLSLYSKCPVHTNNFVYLPDTSAGGASQTLACTGDWAFNELTFQSAPSAEYFFYYIFNADVSWLRVDDVRLTYADGTVPPHAVVHPGVRPVGISGQSVTVDGKPYLSLGLVNVGYNDLQAAAGTGANTVNGLESYSNANCFNTGNPDYLDRAYDLGLNFLPDSTTTARLGDSSVFPRVMQTFAPHKAVLGWQLADEPDLQELPFTYIPPATLNAEYKAVKTATSLPVLFDSQHAAYDTAAYLSPYASSSDIWMAEPYGADFGSVAHAVSVFNSLQSRPIWLYQDAIDAGLIVPKAYWAIVHGVTGLHYFDWDQFKADPARLAAVKQVFTELKTLNDAVFGANYDDQVTGTQGIGYEARYVAGSDSLYVLAVNPLLGGAAHDVGANFSVKGLSAGRKVTVLFENRFLTAYEGGFTDTFAGASRHVYMISGFKNSIPPVGIGVTLNASVILRSGPMLNREWRLRITNTGNAAANGAQLTGVSLTQVVGRACISALIGRNLPLALGNIPAGGSATGDIRIAFAGCDPASLFNVGLTLIPGIGRAPQTVKLATPQKQ